MCQIRRKLRIWSHLLKKSLMENFIILCSVLNWQKRHQNDVSGHHPDIPIVNFEHIKIL